MNREGPASWWGEFASEEEGRAHRWRIGPLTMWAWRRAREWRVAWSRGAAAESDGWSVEPAQPPPEEPEELLRFAFRDPPTRIRVRPRLADRSVVIHPVSPLTLTPRESATLYVSTPLWVGVELGAEPDGGPAAVLHEIPATRPSDTWFGPSTRTGQLCYASRTHARMYLEELPARAYRAITPLEIVNDSHEPLVVERVSLPVPNLQLYAAADRTLWTQAVTLEREPDEAVATLRLKDGPPPETGGAERVGAPRQAPESRVLRRALSALLG